MCIIYVPDFKSFLSSTEYEANCVKLLNVMEGFKVDFLFATSNFHGTNPVVMYFMA